jgi:hypothetical protein
MARVLISITPRMYRQAIALSIRRQRPGCGVKIAGAEAAKRDHGDHAFVGVPFAHDLDVVRGAQHLGETVAKELVVVAQYNPYQAWRLTGAHHFYPIHPLMAFSDPDIVLRPAIVPRRSSLV